MIPFFTYKLSVYKIISDSPYAASSVFITQVNSVLLFVVSDSPPKSTEVFSPFTISNPHPPGPGLPLHVPSVYIVIFSQIGE